MQVNGATFSSVYVETESIFQCTHEGDGGRVVCSFAYFMQHTFFFSHVLLMNTLLFTLLFDKTGLESLMKIL